MRTIAHFIWRKHALERMLARNIARSEVMHCALHGEEIETYLNDAPFPSSLVLEIGTQPLHVVIAIDGEVCYVITAYRPNLDEFESDYKTRKNK